MNTSTNGTRKNTAKISVVPMIAATYFMVAGGPYGLEDIVHKTGYASTLLILVITPLLWSLPTALVVSELATAIPQEGGFYIWVRRGMGRFWGFQETWLTLAGSVFEMALYPNLCIDYIGQFMPRLVAGHRGLILGFAMIALCTAWNILGVRSVGEGSVWLNVALLVPFVALTILALGSGKIAGGSPAPLRHADLLGGVLIAMWNYMGWDNLSTIAGEVETPQRTYSRAMFGAVLLVVVSYLIPVGSIARTGIDPNRWTTGGWVDIGQIVGGETLAIAIALAGVIGAIGSFGALMLSFTRLPLVMAEDGYLPRIFARRDARTGAPWLAILACAVLWAICFPLGFEKSLILDVMLTGLSILLEFWALVALRIREPELERPFRVPGGMAGAVAVGIPPLVLMIAALARNRTELVGSTNELVIGTAVIAAGVGLYFLSRFFNTKNK
ncbi:MAG TPA: APC family permease [Candidatus Acidoferrales bacterium]|jgi:amino acid transporter|nr:APC family permease [Candidatus Acidoferrales bacterium]